MLLIRIKINAENSPKTKVVSNCIDIIIKVNPPKTFTECKSENATALMSIVFNLLCVFKKVLKIIPLHINSSEKPTSKVVKPITPICSTCEMDKLLVKKAYTPAISIAKTITNDGTNQQICFLSNFTKPTSFQEKNLTVKKIVQSVKIISTHQRVFTNLGLS